MIDIEKLRYWLVRNPKGSLIKAYANGECTVIQKHANQTWGDVARTVESIEADRIEVFDDAEKLIRACRLDEMEELQTATDDHGNVVAIPKTKGMSDPETERLKIVATLIADAYKFATGVAWEKMLGLFDAIARKSESTERTLDKAQALITKQSLENLALKMQENEEGSEDLLAQMIQQFMAGKTQGEQTRPTNGSNGKAKS